MKPHGTVGRYSVQRCRCGPCTKANKEYQRERRTYKIIEFEPVAWAPVNGCLAVECWCRSVIVKVAVEDIRAGRTASCGAPDCREEAVWA